MPINPRGFGVVLVLSRRPSSSRDGPRGCHKDTHPFSFLFFSLWHPLSDVWWLPTNRHQLHTNRARLPTNRHRRAYWTLRDVCGGAVDRGVWTAKTVKQPPQQPAHPPIRQLLGAADTQTAQPCHIQHSPNTPTTGLRERRNDTSKSTGRSGRQNAATRRNMRREERVTVQGLVKEQQPDGMSHGGARILFFYFCQVSKSGLKLAKNWPAECRHCHFVIGWGGGEAAPPPPTPPPTGTHSKSNRTSHPGAPLTQPKHVRVHRGSE